MTQPFDKTPQVAALDTLSGVDSTNKDKVVHAGALKVGSTFLAESHILRGDDGTVGEATVVADERTVGDQHFTKLTLTDFAVGTSGDAAALALGALLYTLPAGAVLVEDASVIGALTADISVTTDTPEFGIGNVVGEGAVATLGEVDAGAENVAGPFVATNVAGDTDTDGGVTASFLLIPAADPHTLYFNVADTWANVTAAGAVTFTGVVTLRWRKID